MLINFLDGPWAETSKSFPYKDSKKLIEGRVYAGAELDASATEEEFEAIDTSYSGSIKKSDVNSHFGKAMGVKGIDLAGQIAKAPYHIYFLIKVNGNESDWKFYKTTSGSPQPSDFVEAKALSPLE